MESNVQISISEPAEALMERAMAKLDTMLSGHPGERKYAHNLLRNLLYALGDDSALEISSKKEIQGIVSAHLMAIAAAYGFTYDEMMKSREYRVVSVRIAYYAYIYEQHGKGYGKSISEALGVDHSTGIYYLRTFNNERQLWEAGNKLKARSVSIYYQLCEMFGYQSK